MAAALSPAEPAKPVPATGEEELRRLMVGYQAADADAADRFIRLVSPMLYRFLASSGPLAGDCDDLLQECWIRIHRARHTYRATEPVLPWVFAVARHTKLDGFRRNKRRSGREVLYGEVPEPKAAAVQPDTGAGERLRRMLAVLPESQREVIVMLKVTGMSLEEVARATSSTVGSVKQKAHRAYEKLRVLLGEGRP
ncbi:MAG: RNA polymerase sigma factor [Bryobacteraceae bacterium]